MGLAADFTFCGYAAQAIEVSTTDKGWRTCAAHGRHRSPGCASVGYPYVESDENFINGFRLG
jgi:hypothetical protein